MHCNIRSSCQAASVQGMQRLSVRLYFCCFLWNLSYGSVIWQLVHVNPSQSEFEGAAAAELDCPEVAKPTSEEVAKPSSEAIRSDHTPDGAGGGGAGRDLPHLREVAKPTCPCDVSACEVAKPTSPCSAVR